MLLWYTFPASPGTSSLLLLLLLLLFATNGDFAMGGKTIELLLTLRLLFMAAALLRVTEANARSVVISSAAITLPVVGSYTYTPRGISTGCLRNYWYNLCNCAVALMCLLLFAVAAP